MASKAAQERAIGEGLAIACLSLGVASLPSSRFSFNMSFESAWRSWAHASKFPQVRVDEERNVILGILDDSPRRRGPICAHWEGVREYIPVADHDWTYEELGEHAGSEFAVDLEAWQDLAFPLLVRLGCIEDSPVKG